MSEFVAGSNNEESPPAEEMVSGAGGPGASPGHTANAMTAAHNALTAAHRAGRRYCQARAKQIRNARRRAAYRQQQTA